MNKSLAMRLAKKLRQVNYGRGYIPHEVEATMLRAAAELRRMEDTILELEMHLHDVMYSAEHNRASLPGDIEYAKKVMARLKKQREKVAKS